MNRKLFNGLLLLTVATGGIGTFTSCKDTEQDFRNEVLSSQEQLKLDLGDLQEKMDQVYGLTGEWRNKLDDAIKDAILSGNFEDAEFYKNLQDQFTTLLNKKADITDLNDAISKLEQQYKDAIAANNTEIMNQVGDLIDQLKLDFAAELSGELENLRNSLEEWVNNQIKDAIAEIDLNPLWEAVNGVKTTADSALEKANNAEANAQAALAKANANAELIETMSASITTLQETLTNLSADMEDAKQNISTMQTKLETMSTEVENLKNQYTELNTALEGVKDNVATLTASVTTLTENFSNLESAFGAFKAEMSEYQTNVDHLLGQYGEDIDALIRDVEYIYSNFMQKFANLVTSINVEEVQNAIFGSFSFPLGIESNIIANYYAYSDHPVGFPWFEYEYTTNDDLKGINLTAIDAPTMSNILKADEPEIEKLADLYLTVNPANRNFKGLKLTLVNSQDEQVLDEFKLKETDHVVTMGVTRSAQNGFYAAEMLSADPSKDVPAIRYEIVDGLKGAFKDAIKDHHKADFVELAKLIVKQFGSDMPAYAVKCEWDDTEVNADGEEVAVKNSVRSGYDLAVTAFRPLSYTTAYDIWEGHTVPHIKNDLSMGFVKDRIKRAFDDIKSRLNLGLTGIKVEDITIVLDFDIQVDPTQITIDLSNSPVFDKPNVERGEDDADGNPTYYYINSNGSKVYVDPTGFLAGDTKITLGYDPNTGEVDDPNLTALNPFIESIVDSIMKAIDGDPEAGKKGLAEQITSQVNDQLKSIVDQVNDQLEGVQSKIDNTIADIESKINGVLNGRFGRFADRVLDLYNRLASKVNDIIADPNAYLQVMMAYMGNDNEIHRLSTMANDATPLKVGRTMELFATSYNAEIIVPSFKKYVAVVDATDANGNWGNYEAAKKANKANYLNEVRPGEQQRFYIDGSRLEADRTYKILYSSLDYHGNVSSKVYYVRATN